MSQVKERISYEITSESVEATIQEGRSFSEYLQPGDVVLLEGDLGAGKTHYVKGVAEGLGIDPWEVDSPTFAIVNEYSGAVFPVFHFDCYRIESAREMLEIGWDEYTSGEALCLIEWPQKIAPLLPDEAIRIHISHLDSDKRKIQVIFPA